MIKCIIYEEGEYSDEKSCETCAHATGIFLPIYDMGANIEQGFICWVNCEDNSGIECPKWKEEKTENI